jgi:hypothetical protein
VYELDDGTHVETAFVPGALRLWLRVTFPGGRVVRVEEEEEGGRGRDG